MLRRIRQILFLPVIAGMLLCMGSLAAVLYFNGRARGGAGQADDLNAVTRILNERIELELYRLETEADHLGRMDRLLGASDLLDRQGANRELSQLVNARKGLFSGLHDFEGDIIGVYGVDPPAVENALSASILTSARAGKTSSGIVRIGERAALVAVSPIGGTGTDGAGGSVFLGAYIDQNFLERMIGGLPADLTIASGRQVLTTTLPGSAGAALLKERDLLKPAEDAKGPLNQGSKVIALLSGRSFGQPALPNPVFLMSLAPTSGWMLGGGWLLQAIGAGLFAFFGAMVLAWRGKKIIFESLAQWQMHLSRLRPDSPAGNPAKGTPAGIPEIDHFGDLQTQHLLEWAKTTEELRLSHRKIEQRAHRIIDLLAIEDTEFSFFVRKVRQVEAEAEKELESISHQVGRESQEHIAHMVAALLRSVYSIRNEAHLFKLQFVHQAAKNFEEYLLRVTRGQVRTDQAMLDEMMAQLKSLSGEVSSYCDLREELLGSRTVHETEMGRARLQIQWLKSMMARLLVLVKNPTRDGFHAERLAAEFESALSLVNKQDLRALIERYDRVISGIAEKAGKKINPIRFIGPMTHFRPEIINHLNELFGNVLRNCVHHGIENPDTRLRAEKSAAGNISITSKLWADTVEIQISDDGKGADPQRLVQQAIKAGTLTKEEAAAMTEEEMLGLMFAPGLTTSVVVSDVSGRGVGMDIVRQTVEDLGGSVEVSSRPGEGLSLRVWFRDTLSRFQTRSSVFSLKSEIEGLFASRQYLLERAGITVSLELDQQGRSMVFADKLFVIEAWRQLILAFIAELPAGSSLKIEEIPDDRGVNCSAVACPVVRHRIKYAATRDSMGKYRELDASPFVEIAQDMFIESCVDMELDSASQEIRLAISSNLPATSDDFPLVVLGPDDDAVKAQFAERIETMTGGWPWRYFTYDEVAEFAGESRVSMAIVVVDRAAIARPEIRSATSLLIDANILLVIEDAGVVNPEEIFSVGHDPLIVSGVLDAPAVDQALEMTFLRMFRGASFAASDSTTLPHSASPDPVDPVTVALPEAG